jgi:Arc/MetJ-type ribon-helix-helix transcriptional regulator
MSVRKKYGGRRRCISMTSEMESEVAAYCREKNIESESEVIRRAVSEYIHKEYYDTTLELTAINNTQRKIEDLRDMIEIMFKYVARMHENLLAYNGQIPDELAGAAYLSAQTRHKRFMAVFGDKLGEDPPLFERLLHKYYTDGETRKDDGENRGRAGAQGAPDGKSDSRSG